MKQHRAFFDTSSALGTACFQVSLMFMFILILTNVCLLLPLYSLLHMPNPQVCGSHHLVAPFPELCIQHLWKSFDNCLQGNGNGCAPLTRLSQSLGHLLVLISTSVVRANCSDGCRRGRKSQGGPAKPCSAQVWCLGQPFLTFLSHFNASCDWEQLGLICPTCPASSAALAAVFQSWAACRAADSCCFCRIF